MLLFYHVHIKLVISWTRVKNSCCSIFFVFCLVSLPGQKHIMCATTTGRWAERRLVSDVPCSTRTSTAWKMDFGKYYRPKVELIYDLYHVCSPSVKRTKKNKWRHHLSVPASDWLPSIDQIHALFASFNVGRHFDALGNFFKLIEFSIRLSSNTMLSIDVLYLWTAYIYVHIYYSMSAIASDAEQSSSAVLFRFLLWTIIGSWIGQHDGINKTLLRCPFYSHNTNKTLGGWIPLCF